MNFIWIQNPLNYYLFVSNIYKNLQQKSKLKIKDDKIIKILKLNARDYPITILFICLFFFSTHEKKKQIWCCV